jgi:predicted ribonuclease YlaK
MKQTSMVSMRDVCRLTGRPLAVEQVDVFNLASLTPREREIAELIVQGHSNKEIAHRLDISSKTLDIHRSHIKNKMGVTTVNAVAIMLLRAMLWDCAERIDDYRKLHVAKSVSGLYTGVSNLTGDYDLQSFYKAGELELEGEVSLHPNEFVLLKKEGTDSTAIARHVGKNKLKSINTYSPCKIEGRNKEQKFALDLLLNPEIPLVTVVGSAGTGKTLLAIASGLHQVIV